MLMPALRDEIEAALTGKPGTDSVVITGLGLMTSVGHGVAQAVTSMCAGTARLAEFPGYEPIVRDPEVFFPEPLIAAAVTGVTDGMSGIERLLALAAPALKEAFADAGLKAEDLRNTNLYLATGQHAAVADGTRVAATLAPRLAARLSRKPFQKLHYLPRGSAAVLLALQQASEALRKKLCNYCIIGAVHSWLDTDTLAWLDEKRRLKSPGNPDAFVPGEAAAFLVLETRANAAIRKKEAYAECMPPVAGEEKHTIWVDTPCTAEALSTCLRGVVGELGKRDRKPEVVLCDLNGESYRSTEWSYAMTKVFRDGQPVPPLIHPADCLGDVGAASGGVLIGLAAAAMKMDLVPWETTVVWCSSDNGERAACAVTRA
jgi:3-oxoacyl-[acyl-carrier-protein] synthase-1